MPGRLPRNQVAITGLGLRHFLGYQLVGLVIAGVLIGDDPLDPPVLIGGAVLVRQVDGQGLVARRHVAGRQVTHHLVMVWGRQVKLSGLSDGAGDGLGFDHGLVGVIIDPVNGSGDRRHRIRKGDRQVRVRVGDGHGRSSVGIGGVIVIGQDGRLNGIPMGC